MTMSEQDEIEEGTPLELKQPLEILRSTARRLMERQIPATRGKLDEMYAHLSGAVADILDGVSEQVSRALVLAQESLPAESEVDGEAAQTLEAVEQMLAEVQEEMGEALADIRDTFFAAGSFQECEARLPQLAHFEARLEGSLLRLEQALMMSQDPELFGVVTYEPPVSLSQALEALACGLDELQLHMRDGDREPLRRALEAVQRAQQGLEAALAEP